MAKKQKQKYVLLLTDKKGVQKHYAGETAVELFCSISVKSAVHFNTRAKAVAGGESFKRRGIADSYEVRAQVPEGEFIISHHQHPENKYLADHHVSCWHTDYNKATVYWYRGWVDEKAELVRKELSSIMGEKVNIVVEDKRALEAQRGGMEQ